MAQILETLAVKLVLDAAEFADGISKSESKMAAFGQKLTSIGQGLTLGVTAPIAAMAAKSIDAAGDLGESINKVTVVFDENAAAVLAWSENSAKAIGQSQQQALEAVGTFGNLFDAMGLSSEATLDMSTNLVELASDLASFNNIDPTEALEKLRAGIVGETEPLRTLGVNLTAATIEAKALSMGLVATSVDMAKVEAKTIALEKAQRNATEALAEHGRGSFEYREALSKVELAEQALSKVMEGKVGELTAAQKAQAAYALILEQTTNAQGDFANTSEGLANATRIAKAQFEDASAALGTSLLPVATQAASILNNLLERFNNLDPATQAWIVKIGLVAAAVGPVLVVIGSLITAVTSISAAFAAAGPLLAAAGAAIAALSVPIAIVIAAISVLAIAWSQNWLGIREVTAQAWQLIKATVTGDWETVNAILTAGMQALQSFMSNTWTAIKNAITVALNGIRSSVQSGMAAVQSIFSNVWGAIKGNIDSVIASIRAAFRIDWSSLGRGIVSGIASGIRSGAGAIASAARSAAQSALASAKAALGIRSPSRLARDQIGMPFGQGIAEGIDESMRGLSADVAARLNAMVGGISGQVNVGGAGVGGGGMTISIQQSFNGNVDRGAAANGSRDGVLEALRQAGFA